MKTAELTGAALDWAVAKCEGVNEATHKKYWFASDRLQHYSTDWSQGGPIIERERISVAQVGRTLGDAIAPHPDCWCAHTDGVFASYGHTPLTAAMRCYVASKLGDKIEIPEELT